MAPSDLDSTVMEQPASEAETRSAYVDQAIVAYLLYGVGAVTAFLAVVLTLSDAAAAAHSSAMAVGLLAAGMFGDRLDTRLGSRTALRLAYALAVAGVLCLLTALAFALTLTGAALVGLSAGLMLARLNRTFTRGGGALARLRMGRGALVAMVASLSVPIIIGFGENSGLGWQLALIVALALIGVGSWASRHRGDITSAAADASGRLPRSYWLAWWLIVLGVSVEFSLVFWSSTLVERQVGISLADATLVAAGFYAGMATARVGLSVPVVSRRDPVLLMRLGLVIALLGSLLAWAADSTVLAGLGIYLGGLGTGFLYPLGVAVALALVPGLQDRGSSRLILASGLAILAAPFILGVAAGAAGVSIGWLLIPALCVAALILSVPVGRARQAHTPSLQS